jgi:hypothetical protein
MKIVHEENGHHECEPGGHNHQAHLKLFGQYGCLGFFHNLPELKLKKHGPRRREEGQIYPNKTSNIRLMLFPVFFASPR